MRSIVARVAVVSAVVVFTSAHVGSPDAWYEGNAGPYRVIVQVAIKVRPLPHARRTLRFGGDLALARELVDTVHGSTAVLATPGAVELRLEGWPDEIEEQTSSARHVADATAEDDAPFPLERPWEAMPVVVEV